MKVYITKYWETRGIYSAVVLEHKAASGLVVVKDVKGMNGSSIFHGKEYHFDMELARRHVEECVSRRIASLAKKLAGLRALDVEEMPVSDWETRD